MQIKPHKAPICGVLFDLDGTLVDTAPDLVHALNLALLEHGFPPKPLEAVRDAASHGSLALVSAAQPELPDTEKVKIQQSLLSHYQQINGQHSRLFEGMDTLLLALIKANIPFGVVTNKAARFARPLLDTLEVNSTKLANLMPSIISGDSTRYSKPHSAPMLLAAQQLNCPPASILYLGDAERDLQAAYNSGMQGGIALWGYIAKTDKLDSWPHDYRFETPEEVIPLID
ncbi:HAD-IA family hydrolase [Shewanella sp. AS1]|uniref:HAD family hydrolase n=1 Tax=Shewanella sp. AS1 TaxID=2907626 RepID=UPI001F1908D0|nr:HAD-IA family hydrolase [Shewanella sp. AS1]MCE9678423.1 HAD-IA family hydrolase [Shewanella sp. AS1]